MTTISRYPSRLIDSLSANLGNRLPRLAALLLIAVSLLVAPGIGRAADQTPHAFLQLIYQQYVGKNAGGVKVFSDNDYKRYFTPDLANTIIADNAKAAESGDIPALDGDPFIGHQDWQISDLNIDVDDKATDKTTGKVTFKNLGEMETVTVDLLKVDGAWKADDVHWAGGDSLRSIYKQ